MFLNKNILDEDKSKSLNQQSIYNNQNSEQNNQTQQQNYQDVKSRVTNIEARMNPNKAMIQKEQEEEHRQVEEDDNNILLFQDLDDYDDIQSQSVNLNNPLIESQTNQQVNYDQRQKIIEQQKQVLMKPNQSSYNVSVNEGFIKNLGKNQSNYDQSHEIDYDQLQQNNTSYEPGQFQYKIGGQLPQLRRLENNSPEQSHNVLIEAILSKNNQSTQGGIFMKQRTTNDTVEEEHKNQNQGQKTEVKIEQLQELQSLTDSDREGQDQKEGFIQIQDEPQQTQKSSQYQELDVSQSNVDDEEQKMKEKEQQQKILNAQKKLPYPKPFALLSIPDMKSFLTNPSPRGGMIQCTIKRDKSGMGRFYPRYHMHLSSGYQFLMIAKKRACNNTSNYIVSMNRNDPEKKSSGEFLGKVRSNFLGTEFVLYDDGDKPKKSLYIDKQRKELGIVLYESNLLGAKGPRKMKVLLPKVLDSDCTSIFRPNNDKEGILPDYKNGAVDGITSYVNRHPKWNEVVQAFVLNFYGRVDKPSVKNFQLIEQGTEDNIYLQFGRIGEEMFNLDFQWPLSPLQAFEIAISSFDYKIACE